MRRWSEIGGPDSVSLRAFRSTPYSDEQRSAIREAIRAGTPRDLALLHVGLGHRLADAAAELLERAGVAAARARPHRLTRADGVARAGARHLQLGDPAIIAERTGVRVVSDFRSRDVAAGGQGAPLVPLADAMLFGHPERGRALLNVGGMANVTWVPRRGDTDGVIAFDTGPGVAVMDAVTQLVDPGTAFDEGGARAARGIADAALLASCWRTPSSARSRPRARGGRRSATPMPRSWCAACRMAGPAATTAWRLLSSSLRVPWRWALERWLSGDGERDVLVSGGGARNPTLMRRLAALLEGWDVKPFEEEFFDGDAKEAVAFAYLGWRATQGLTSNVPSATGAKGPRVLGSITPA